MSAIGFENLSVDFEGQQLEALSLSTTARRVGLVGDWQPLFALLSGTVRARGGRMSYGGADARLAVVSGDLGVADPTLPLPADIKLHDWISLSLRLAGQPHRDAATNADRTLERLGVLHLGRYALGTLPLEGQYAARIALACSRRPGAVVLPMPVWSPRSAQTDSALLDLAAQPEPAAQSELVDDEARDATPTTRQILIHCDPATQPELFLSCDLALVAEETGCTSLSPRQLRDGGKNYQLLALDNGPALAAQLESQGAKVLSFRGALELWVTLPPGANTELLVRAALESNAPLGRMSPLFRSSDAGS